MDRLDLTCLCRQPERLGRNMKDPRGFAEVEPGLVPVFGWLVYWDAVVRAQRGDALTRPAVAMARDEAVPVEDAGYDIIGGNEHELSDSGHDIGRGAVALTPAAAGQAHLAVDATAPVDHEYDLSRLGVDIGHHFLDHGAHDALLQPCVGRGSSPDGPEV